MRRLKDQVKILDNWLTIRNYKEPLKAIPTSVGFGYYGTLLGTPDGEFVMCHACGKLFKNLATHIKQAHKEQFKNVAEYREVFDLAHRTALVSESERIRLKKKSIEFFNSLTEKQKAEYRRRADEGRLMRRQHYQPKIRLETKNKRGTCPDQLLDKIQQVKDNLGHTPTLKEFMRETGGQRFKRAIFATFGSWVEALYILGLEPRNPLGTRGGRKSYYDEETLLEMMRAFTKKYDAAPTSTDCKRGLLPAWNVYKRVFGSFETARQLAGVYQMTKNVPARSPHYAMKGPKRVRRKLSRAMV